MSKKTAVQLPASRPADGQNLPSSSAMEQHPPSSSAVGQHPPSTALLMEDAGIDQYDSQDVALPFIQILQQLSPQVNKRDSAYIEGAEAGMFINTATGELWDGEQGIVVIPAKYQRRYTEWRPRSEGGGLVRDWGSDDSILKDCSRSDLSGRDTTSEGNEVVTSGTFYGLILPVNDLDRQPVQGVISMQVTQFKKARKWNALITSHQLKRPDGKGYFTPPMFSRSYLVTSVPESNDQGNWFGFKVSIFRDTHALPNGEEIYLLAREFRRLIDGGGVQVQAAPEPKADIPF